LALRFWRDRRFLAENVAGSRGGNFARRDDQRFIRRLRLRALARARRASWGASRRPWPGTRQVPDRRLGQRFAIRPDCGGGVAAATEAWSRNCCSSSRFRFSKAISFALMPGPAVAAARRLHSARTQSPSLKFVRKRPTDEGQHQENDGCADEAKVV